MNLEERVVFLETLNKNQEETIKSLSANVAEWERQNDKLNIKLAKYNKLLDDLCDQADGSLLWYQYKWMTQKINKFLMEMHDD